MDEETVRDHAEALSGAIVRGDVDTVIADFSAELRHNLGETIALLPLPALAAGIESIEHGAAGFVVVLRLTGEAEEVLIQTRWKDRDGEPTVVEVSHLSRVETVAIEGEPETEPDTDEPA